MLSAPMRESSMSSTEQPDLAWDEVYRYEARPALVQKPKRKSRALATFVLLFIGSSFFLKGTLAANISLGGGVVEFGQGTQVTTACSGSTALTVTPTAAFSNQSGSGTFYFKSFKISNIPSGCYGKTFTLNAYDSITASTLALFDGTTKDAVIFNDNGNYLSASGSSITIVTHSTSSFTATFATPASPSATVARITLQSSIGQSPYNYNSAAFTASSYMMLSPGVSPGTGAFTIEAWIKTGSTVKGGDILGNSNNTGAMSFILDDATTAHIDGYNIYSYTYTLPITLQPNTWYHIAIARNGSDQETIWVNGTRSTTGVQLDTIDYFDFATGINWAHCTWCVSGGSTFDGERISNLRAVVGTSLYNPNSASITVPTMPLANVANTKLLMTFNNSSSLTVDSSGNQTITNFGATFASGQ
jgi:hypothetical protein